MLRLDYTSDKWGKGKIYYYHHFRKNPPSLMQDSEGNYFIRGYIKVTPLGIDDWDTKQPFRTKLMPPPKVCTKLGLLELIKYRDNAGKIQIINFEDRYYVAHPNAEWTFISSPVKEENPKIDWTRRRNELEALVKQGKTFNCPYCGNILPDVKEYIQYHFCEVCMKLPYDAYVKYCEKQNPSRQQLHDMLRRLKMPLDKFDALIQKYGTSERLWEHLHALDSAIAISSRGNPQQFHAGDYVLYAGYKPFKFVIQTSRQVGDDVFVYDIQTLNTDAPVLFPNVRQIDLIPYPFPEGYGDIEDIWNTWTNTDSERFLSRISSSDLPERDRPTQEQMLDAAQTEWDGLSRIVTYDFKPLIANMLRRFKMIPPPLSWRFAVGDYVEYANELPFKFRVTARGRIPADGSPGYDLQSDNTEGTLIQRSAIREELLTAWQDEPTAEAYWDSWSSGVRYNFWIAQVATLNTETVRRVIEQNWSDLSSDDQNTLDVLLMRYHMLPGIRDDSHYRFTVGQRVTYDGAKPFMFEVFGRVIRQATPEYHIKTPNTQGHVFSFRYVSQDELHLVSAIPVIPAELWESWSRSTRNTFMTSIRPNLLERTPAISLTSEQIGMIEELHWESDDPHAVTLASHIKDAVAEQMKLYHLVVDSPTVRAPDFVLYEGFPFKYEVLSRDSDSVMIVRVDSTQRSTAFTARYNQITSFVTRDTPRSYWEAWQHDTRFMLLGQASVDSRLSWADSEMLGMSSQNWDELGTGARIAVVYTMHQYGLLPNYHREGVLAFEREDADTHIRVLKIYAGEGVVLSSIEEFKNVINQLTPELLTVVWDVDDSPIGQGEIDSWLRRIAETFDDTYYIRRIPDSGMDMVRKTAMDAPTTTPAPTPTPAPTLAVETAPLTVWVFRRGSETIYQLPNRAKFSEEYFSDMLESIETFYPSRKIAFKWSLPRSDAEYDPVILQTLHDMLLREDYTVNFLTDRRIVTATKTVASPPAPTLASTSEQPPATATTDQVALSRYSVLGAADRRKVLAFLGYDYRKIRPSEWDSDMTACIYAFLMENYPLPWMQRGEENPLIPHEMLFIAADVFTIAVGAVLARMLLKFITHREENPKKEVSNNWIIEYDIKTQGIGSIEEFVKRNDPEQRITTLRHWLEADTLPKNKFVFVLYDPTSKAPEIYDRIQGITGFEINPYGNLTHAWMVSSLKHRRAGVASKLMRFQEVIGRALGAQRIYATVKKDNIPSQEMLWSLEYYPWKEGETVYEVVKQIGSETRGAPSRISIPGRVENPETRDFQEWLMQEAEEVARISEPASNPPYHTEFRHFKPEVIEAVKHYFEVEKPWQGSDADKLGKMKGFLAVLAGIYNIPVPTLRITSPGECGSGYYRPGTHEIHLPKISVTTLLHEFRHAMQHTIPEAKTRADQKGIEPDARAWSLSLWYVAEPRYFMKMVREGRIFFVEDVPR